MIIKLTLVTILVVAVGEAKKWERYEFPNPRQNPDKCGHNRVSYICDPDEFLDDDQARLLDKEIELVMNYTSCPCASHACDKGARGYKIGVAILEEIEKDDKKDKNDKMNEVDHNLEESLKFSYYLLSEWNLGECAEDLVIFYSVKDHVVYTTTNDITRKKLGNYEVGEISMAHRKELQDGDYYNGIKSMILDYKKALLGQYKRRSGDPAGPQYAAQVGGGQSASVLPCFSSVILLTIITCLLH